MNVVFRVDASRRIGTGHVMRCLALARGLTERGAAVSFVCADLAGNLAGHLEESGYTVHRLPRPAADSRVDPSDDTRSHEAWLGASWQTDAEQTRAAIERQGDGVDWLIVDHYALDHRWENAIAPLVRGILVIDDLADRRHACDILLDQNLPDDDARYEELVDENTVTLLGPRYALLRPEFAEARRHSRIRDDGLRRLLIMFGGFDETGETLKALRGVADMSSDLDIDVVISERNRHEERVERIVTDLDRASLHTQPPDIAGIMSRADFSLGAGGVTLWERCAARLPSASTVVAENQRAQIRAAAEAGLTLPTGDAENTSEPNYREILQGIQKNPTLLKRMSESCGKAVDGKGVQRIIAALEEKSTESIP